MLLVRPIATLSDGPTAIDVSGVTSTANGECHWWIRPIATQGDRRVRPREAAARWRVSRRRPTDR